MQAYYDPGQDPIVPYFEKKEGSVKVQKLALLQSDRMVGTVESREGFYIKMMRDKFENGSIELKIKTDKFQDKMFEKQPKEEAVYITIDDIRSGADIKLTDPKALVYEVEIDADVRVLEMSEPIMAGDPKMVKQLEKVLSGEMKKEIADLLKKLQKINSDPIGFGTLYDTKVRGVKLTEEEWHKKFPTATFHVNVKTNILRTGVMD
jgi:spore germination protein